MGHDVKFQLERKFDFFSMNEGHVYVSNEFTNDSLNLKYSRAESTASSGFPAVWGISCLILKQDLNPFLFFLLFLLSSSIPITDFVFFTMILACLGWVASRRSWNLHEEFSPEKSNSRLETERAFINHGRPSLSYSCSDNIGRRKKRYFKPCWS